MNLIIAGGRDFDDYKLLVKVVDQYILDNPTFFDIDIICGMAIGADLLGKQYGDEKGINVIPFHAKWRVNGIYDPKAGTKRNKKMGDIGTDLIAFWDGISTGTGNMKSYARSKGLNVLIVRY